MGTGWSSLSLYSLSGKTITIFFMVSPYQENNRSCKTHLLPGLGSHILLPPLHWFWSGQVTGPAQVKGQDKWAPLPHKMSSKVTSQKYMEVGGIVVVNFEKSVLESSFQSQFTFLLQTKYTQLIPHSLIPLLGEAQNLVADDLYQVQIQMRYRNS